MVDRKDGFTPLFDDVVREVGTTAALVFGAVWRHEQMRDGYAHASVKTMARLIGVSERTVRYKLRVLEEGGWIVQIAESSGHTPTSYRANYVPFVLRDKPDRAAMVADLYD